MGRLPGAQPQEPGTGARRTSTTPGGDTSSPGVVLHVILRETGTHRTPSYHELRCGNCGCHFTALNIFKRSRIGCPLCGIRAKVIFNITEES